MNLQRLIAFITLAAFTLSACSRGFYPAPPDTALPQVSLQAPVQKFLSFDDAAALAAYGGSPVVPLFAVPDIDTNIGTLDLTFWGTKDAAGKITQLTEAGVSGLTSTVHVFFDTSERPVYFRDDGSGYAVRLSYDSASQQTVTLCDPSNSALASSQITIANGVASAGPAYDGGTCNLGPTAAARTRSGVLQGTPVATDLSNLSSLSKLITAGSYIAGLGFALGAITKFKQHKDNPTVIPIGTPIALVFIAAALLFIPAILSTAGSTLFGSYNDFASVDGLAGFLAETSLPGCSMSSASCPFPNPEATP